MTTLPRSHSPPLPVLLCLALALICGCATRHAPTPKPAAQKPAAKKAPPTPPLPPGLNLPVAKAASQPVQVAQLNWQPASHNLALAAGTNAFIQPYGPDYYLVGFWQQSNSTLLMQYAEDIIPAVDWEFLALYGAIPSAQYVAAAIPARWTASGRLFTRGINQPEPPAAAFAARSLRHTKQTVEVHGRRYDLHQIGVPQAIPFQVFELKPR